MSKKLEEQFKKTKSSLKPSSLVHDGLQEMLKLMEMMFKYLEKQEAKK